MRKWVLSHCSCVQLFATLRAVACQAPLPMGFFRQEYWNGLPCCPPGDLPNPETEPVSLTSPALADRFLTTIATWEAPIRAYVLVITLNENELNATTKRHILAEWIQNQDPCIFCLWETHFKYRDIHRLKVRGWKYTFHANRHQKKAGVVTLLLDKIGFKIKTVIKDKGGHYIMTKESIREETTINI